MDEEFFDKTREEFIDFISDMLITDNALANNILNEYFRDETPECWDLRTSIVATHYTKRRNIEKKTWKNL